MPRVFHVEISWGIMSHNLVKNVSVHVTMVRVTLAISHHHIGHFWMFRADEVYVQKRQDKSNFDKGISHHQINNQSIGQHCLLQNRIRMIECANKTFEDDSVIIHFL